MLDRSDHLITYIPPGRHDALREMALDLVFLAALMIAAAGVLVAFSHALPVVA